MIKLRVIHKVIRHSNFNRHSWSVERKESNPMIFYSLLELDLYILAFRTGAFAAGERNVEINKIMEEEIVGSIDD